METQLAMQRRKDDFSRECREENQLSGQRPASLRLLARQAKIGIAASLPVKAHMPKLTPIRSVALVLRITLAALMAAALSGCADVTSYYDNLNEARADRLFERGWLPDILPASAHDLKVATTMDIGAGRGRFRFDPEDYPVFTAQLSAHDGTMSIVDSDNYSIRRLLERDYEAYSFAGSRVKWAFLCDQKEAICEFFIW